jgi:hypothetical protein
MKMHALSSIDPEFAMVPWVAPRLRPPRRAAGRALPLAWCALGLGLGLALAISMAGGAQNAGSRGQYQQPIGQSSLAAQNELAEGDVSQKTKQLRQLNAMRQKAIVADTDKLLRLARELDEEIGRTSPDSLSPVELRKLAEIEKLAHGVKEKMSYSPQGGPVFQQPLAPSSIR